MTKVIVLGILLSTSGLNAYTSRDYQKCVDVRIFTSWNGVPADISHDDRRVPFILTGEDLQIYRMLVRHRKMEFGLNGSLYLIVYKRGSSAKYAFYNSSVGPCASGVNWDCGKMGSLIWTHGKWKLVSKSSL